MKLGSSADGSDDYRNAPNTYGWVVEIDPFSPDATPKKRTALGRFAHCTVRPVPDDAFRYAFAGRPYMRRMFWKLR